MLIICRYLSTLFYLKLLKVITTCEINLCSRQLLMFFLKQMQHFCRVGYFQAKYVDLCENVKVKACVRYFLSNFYFLIKWSAFKNYEKYFLFHLKTSFRSRDIQIFVIFSLPFHTFQIQKGKWKWNNLWCHNLVCINLQM